MYIIMDPLYPFCKQRQYIFQFNQTFSFASNFLLSITVFKGLKFLILVQEEFFYFPDDQNKDENFLFLPSTPPFLHILEKSCLVDILETLVTISLVEPSAKCPNRLKIQ